MRTLALASGGLFLLAATQQTALPAPLARDFDTLAKAPSLTVVYTVRIVGEAPAAYKFVLSRPGAFRLTTPTGFVLSDGKTVTTYKSATNSYATEPYGDAWAKAFAKRPEVMPWAPFFLKEPGGDLASAKVGASRTILGSETVEVEVTPKKDAPATLFLDKKLGVARGALLKTGEKETLIQAKEIAIGKEPMAAETFAFVAPEGAKEEIAASAGVTFAQVNALIQDRCMPCHGGANPRAGINLASYDGVKGIVVPGDPAGSLLIKSVKGEGVKKMPLGNHPALSADEIKLWSDWVAAGAKNE